ncbi:hypothetical protein Dsin_022248 [Dipteronia sinensis]|uniref:Crooked neck protein n=1 Tax=Dipteronia sinensis TaxID=43782 RepID=A0AAE0DZL1_9ROSI|nr:hypothetical protein Dsin_022248 [Dipteronia sinensis]
MKNKFINHARNVWDRAVTLLPRVDQLWYKYIHTEEMLGNVAGARQIFERWMNWMPDQQGWLSYIKFELSHNEVDRARQIFERFVLCHPKVLAWIRYAKFKMKNGEIGRSRNVYERTVDELADNKEAEQLFVAFAEFEERCKKSESARLEESLGNNDRIREVYERAIANVPPAEAEEKRYWQRYIYLWVNYALYRSWTWEIWSGHGMFIGNNGLQRNCYARSKYAELERSLAETDRARAIFELAIAQPALDMPELLWKAYIEFEKSEGEYEGTRALYERLLDRTKHLKVWISYAKFEAFDSKEDDGGSNDVDQQKMQSIQRARRIFEKAINYYMSAPELKEERAMLLEEWLNMESSIGELGDASLVQAKLPKKLKRRRQIVSDDGLATGSEEFYDYLFPEEAQTTNLKILEAAYKWKKKKISADNCIYLYFICCIN